MNNLDLKFFKEKLRPFNDLPEIFLNFHYHPDDEKAVVDLLAPILKHEIPPKLIPIDLQKSIHIPRGLIISIGSKGTVKFISLYG
jgi:hypothetical protein